MRLPVTLAILFSSFVGHLCFAASEREHGLIPGPDGKDLTRGNKRVLISAPKGWELVRVPARWARDSALGFGLEGRRGGPVIEIETHHIGHHNSANVTPRNSYMGVNLETDIEALKCIETFDAGVNGRLDLWRFRTYNRNYLLVLLVRPDNEGRTEVDAYLSADDVTQLMQYVNSLKEVARSIRVVNR